MKNFGIILITLLAITFAGTSCKSDDPVAAKTTYTLNAKDAYVSGTVSFIEKNNSTVIIEINLTGSADALAGEHPAELCMNSAIEDGETIINLEPVDETGKSTTTTTIKTYKELIAYDGCVRVHHSTGDYDKILSIGDIGGNKITSTKKNYVLLGTRVGISGTALFEKRVNGNALVTISLDGAIAGEYPTTINIGSVGTVGEAVSTKTLESVTVTANGTTGKSYTNIRTLDDTKFKASYDNWLDYVGYINIYQDSENYDNIICQGNIGASAKK